ncbi:MAG: hypothetical protein H0T15_02995, partial [Thermoleophilaceae bacterium]|nr:hypothetical protein [Thermoleophilaceae bacterium]
MDRLDAAQRIALGDVWDAFWRSRLVVWVAGMASVLAFGRVPDSELRDSLGLTEPFGPLGDLLVAPAARWDSAWYLDIALNGYDVTARAAFFPLYPLLLQIGQVLTGSPLLVGLVVSALSTFAALYGIHRLTALELGEERARTVVMLVAFFPAALFLT